MSDELSQTSGTGAGAAGSQDMVQLGGWTAAGRRWARPRRPVIIAGVALASLLGGAGVAWAASGSGTAGGAPAAASSAAPSAPPSASGPGFRHFRGFPGGPGLGFGGLLGAVHGQFVVPKAGGGYQTVDVQSGQVTAVSSTSITLKSADGYTRSYAITGSTIVAAQRAGIGSVKAGNQVSVIATVSGSTASAVSIIDKTLLGQRGPAFGFAPGAGGPAGR